jgi:hypothetical protein
MFSHVQCDVRHKQTADSWQYTPAKNKQKLRTQKRNRLAKKLADTAAAAAAATTTANGGTCVTDTEAVGPIETGKSV